MPTKAELQEANTYFKVPANLDECRMRRYEVADILNTNLLAPESRKQYEELYAALGQKLTEAVKAEK